MRQLDSGLSAPVLTLAFNPARAADPIKTAALTIDASKPGAAIGRRIFGQFAEHGFQP